MKTDNTIVAFHIIGTGKNGALKLRSNKLYHWNIPKRLRGNPIQKGDIVLVAAKKGRTRVLVMDVFREEFEETQKIYKKVIKVINRAPQNEKSDKLK